jgi:hypothetical protein
VTVEQGADASSPPRGSRTGPATLRRSVRAPQPTNGLGKRRGLPRLGPARRNGRRIKLRVPASHLALLLRASVRRHRRALGGSPMLRSIRPKRVRHGQGTSTTSGRYAQPFGQTILGARGRLDPGPHLTRYRGILRPVGWGSGPATTWDDLGRHRSSPVIEGLRGRMGREQGAGEGGRFGGVGCGNADCRKLLYRRLQGRGWIRRGPRRRRRHELGRRWGRCSDHPRVRRVVVATCRSGAREAPRVARPE